MSATDSKFVRITYPSLPKLSRREKAARERLETAIHQAIEQYHEVGFGLNEIELYPCDETCEERKLEAA